MLISARLSSFYRLFPLLYSLSCAAQTRIAARRLLQHSHLERAANKTRCYATRLRWLQLDRALARHTLLCDHREKQR